MVIKKINITKAVLLFSIALTGFAATTFAQQATDSSNKVLLASLNKKTEPLYITKEANVVFPELLKGNEAASSEYIQNFSTKRRDYLIRMYSQGKKLLPKACAILKKYHLPEELKVLMTLESAYNPNAVSGAGAVGYWQIMDAVAKEYGLKYAEQMDPAEKKKLIKLNAKKADSLFKAMAKVKDDRKNFIKSTTAAARYLHDRRVNLNDNWLLIVASYNCGVGNVWNAMKKSGKATPDFWAIKQFLPAETQAYVMNFITLNVIFANYEKFIKNNLSFTPVKILIPDNNVDQNMSEETSDEILVQ